MELLTYSYALAKDQGGCRMLQKILLEDNKEVAEVIFESVADNCFELMKDGFGNYLIQKLFEISSQR